MKQYKAIIFDFDDTLVKTMMVRFEAMIYAAKKLYNITLTEEMIAAEWGKPFDIIMTSLFGTTDPLPVLKQKYFDIINKGFKARPQEDALATISYLKATYILAIVTSASRDIFSTDFEAAGFKADDFFSVQTASDTDVHKPNPDVFLPTLTKLKQADIDREETLYIGDNRMDYEAASAAHLDFIGITTGVTTKEEFERIGVLPSLIIDSHKQLQQML